MGEGHGDSRDMNERSRANRAASEWVVLLQEDPGDKALHAEFAEWLADSRLHRDAWSEAQRISHVVRTTRPAYANHWQGAVSSIVPFIGRKRVGRGATIAAAAAAACLAIVVAPGLLLNLRADVVSDTGEIRSVDLADGSTMVLAPQSAVAVDVSKGGRREVRLLQGSAWFEVARDPDHPFRVETSGATTTVLGTAFEVSRTGEQVSVAVRNGHVRVACTDHNDAAEELTAGDALDLNCDDSAMRRRDVDPSRLAAWTDNQIVASDRPVKELIDALKPWHNGIILTFGEGLDARRVTGVYDARQSERVLQALARSHDMTVHNLTPWITVISAD